MRYLGDVTLDEFAVFIDRRVLAILERIDHKLDRLLRMEKTVMADLARIEASVAAEGDAVTSAITLLGELAQLVRDAGSDPAALAALADQIDGQKQALADAVVANTPAAP
jgi:hypothetical protein